MGFLWGTMIFHENLYIDPVLRPAMANIGIIQFEDYIKYSGGVLVSRPSKRQVRTLVLHVQGQRKKYFLKRVGRQSIKEVLKKWCRFQIPYSELARERLIIQLFRDQRIPVMNPVAWGERKVCGWSLGGFILVEEVVGREFVEVYRTASPKIRRRLMRVYGELLGTLHQKGIDSKVHPRDLICISEDYETFRKCLVVIDRERGRTNRVKLFPKDRGKALADIWVKGILSVGQVSIRELYVFLSSYFCAFGTSRDRQTRSQDLVHGIRARAADILSYDKRFFILQQEFSKYMGFPINGK